MDRAEIDDGEPSQAPAVRLRERWRSRSLLAGWAEPGDWWTPAVEAVVEAASGHGERLLRSCRHLGRARGRSGAGIGETLDDLGALCAVLCWPDPPLALVRAVAEGWVDTALLGLAIDACEDPLTGLATLPYLRSRLAELYRAAAVDGRAVCGTHCLVVVDLSDGSPPWRRLARVIVVGADLRMVFNAGETLTLVGAGRAVVLVPIRPELEFQTAGLRRALGGSAAAVVWTEHLPATFEEATTLLDHLAAP